MDNENAYYVMHPSLRVTAVVYAPATEKARTTFLDWLERNGYMRRADRQALRKNMVAQRLDDAQGVSSDIVLHYDYEDARLSQVFSGQPVNQLEPTDVEEHYEKLFEEKPIEVPKEESGPKMPIQKVMLRGLG